jgi:hypothetical protein
MAKHSRERGRVRERRATRARRKRHGERHGFIDKLQRHKWGISGDTDMDGTHAHWHTVWGDK